MIREWDVLTSTRNYSPRVFWLMKYDNCVLMGSREQIIKELDNLLDTDQISYDTRTQLKNSIRGK